MAEIKSLSARLVPELEAEIATTRRMLAAVPDGHDEFKPHEKSMTLSRLAAHVAELPAFGTLILMTPGFDLAAPSDTPWHKWESTEQNQRHFEAVAAEALKTLGGVTDEQMDESWKLSFGDHAIFDGTKYSAYRAMGLNHLVHHRAQLGVYLRLLEVPVPKTYGPSADEQ